MSIDAMTADELIDADLMAIPHWAVVNAVRYALDHPWEESNTIATCDWLVGRWRLLPEHVRETVRSDVEEEMSFVSIVHIDGIPDFPLNPGPDRREWGRVRALWASTA